jgi:type IV pilus assembly protein PilM
MEHSVTQRIVGVDIGSESIRAVEVENPHGPVPVVTRFHEVALPPGAVESGEVVQVATVASLLTELWSAGGFRSKSVVLGVGNPRVLVRDLTVPRAGVQQIRDSLAFQVQDLLTVPVADAILDFYPVSEGTEDGVPVLHGLLVAAVKETINAAIAAVRAAGLTPLDVDLIPFALVRLQAKSLGGATVALVDVGARTTTVVVTVRGVPHFVRIIPTGGYDLTSTLADRLAVTPDAAEQLKRRLGVLPVPSASFGLLGETEVDAAAAAVIRDHVSDLLEGVRNTIRYFVNGHSGTKIDGVVLSGGGADLPGFRDALSEITRLPVLVTDPFAGVRFSGAMLERAVRDTPAPGQHAPSQHAPADQPSHPLTAMAVALGLALGHTSGRAA